MSQYQYLQLQPLEPNDDGSDDSDLDKYDEDETIDLSQDIDGEELQNEWQQIVSALGDDAQNNSADDKQ